MTLSHTVNRNRTLRDNKHAPMDVELKTIYEDVFLFDFESLVTMEESLESLDSLDSFGGFLEENSKNFPAFSFLPPRQNSMTIDSDPEARGKKRCWLPEDTYQQNYSPSFESSVRIGRQPKHPRIIETCKDCPECGVTQNSNVMKNCKACKHKCVFKGRFSFLPPRQNSMTIDSDPEARGKKRCWCSEDTCQQKYSRQSKHPRIIEPSSKLRKGGFDKKVQIRIPKELQSHISYGSCKHAYRALVTLITYVQLKCDFKKKSGVYQTFRAPSRENYEHARRVIKGFGLIDDFYVSIWAPTFQCRFVAACGGIGCVQNCIRDFFASGFVQKQKVQKQKVQKQEVDDFKSECLHIQKILSDHTMDDIRKMSLCTGILYEAIKNPIKNPIKI